MASTFLVEQVIVYVVEILWVLVWPSGDRYCVSKPIGTGGISNANDVQGVQLLRYHWGNSTFSKHTVASGKLGVLCIVSEMSRLHLRDWALVWVYTSANKVYCLLGLTNWIHSFHHSAWSIVANNLCSEMWGALLSTCLQEHYHYVKLKICWSKDLISCHDEDTALCSRCKIWFMLLF